MLTAFGKILAQLYNNIEYISYNCVLFSYSYMCYISILRPINCGYGPVAYILQVRYEQHLSDKICCSEASQFSITKVWYA